jgi:sterol desaturase/sphingolipid hydroxylase (fatty acid hydroxylase superfamily)
MEGLFSEHGSTVFALAFFGALCAVAIWEVIAPRRMLQMPLGRRWLGNFTLMFINTALLRWLTPISGFALAATATQQGWGRLNQIEWPVWAGAFAAVVLLDFNRFVQHVLLHKVPLLWRIHRLHHSDLDFDFTTQLRFHPFEVVFSIGCYSLFIVAFGLPAVGIFLYSLLTAMTGFLQHGNVRIWPSFESILRWFIIPPDLHLIHHSRNVVEANSNFGLLSIWDRMTGTFLAQPAGGYENVQVGLTEYQDEESQRLRYLLTDPCIRR